MQLTKKSGRIVIGLGFYEPWLTLLKNGQEITWLSGERPTNIKITHVHALPLRKLGQTFDKHHERMRFSSRVISRLLQILDLIVQLPLMFWVPKSSISERLLMRDGAIEIKCPDTYLFLRAKNLGMFRWFIDETDEDYLIATTNSSYLNLPAIDKLLQSLPDLGVYLGPVPYQNANFVSGSFRIFSRDVVKLILDNSYRWDPTVLEDVGIGKLLFKKNVKPKFIQANNFSQLSELENLSDKYLVEQLHFRLKSGDLKNRQDILLMKYIHSRYQELGVTYD
jgi:hypothetical protein